MKPFIELNTKMRTAAKNAFEKDFYKLMSNAVYGKTLENVRNRQNVYIINDPIRKKRLTSKPNFKSVTHFNKNLAAVHMGKTEIELNKPVYCGASILDLSKYHMFDFHYNYALQLRNVFQDISGDIGKWYDTSGYPPDFPHLPVWKNKKVLGVFKDECGGKIMTEFVALRANCNSFLMENGKMKKKVKGVKKNVEKSIMHEDFKKTLFTGEIMNVKQNLIRSRLHNLYTEKMKKIALSVDDDKRIVLEDKISTLAIGHKKVLFFS